MSIERIDLLDRALVVQFDDGNSIKFEDCWLRDNCRCLSCYHADTHQRAKHLLEIPDATIKSVNHDKSNVFVIWSDNHESAYSKGFLVKFDYKRWKGVRRHKPILWYGDINDKIPRIHVDDFIQSVEAAERVFQSLLDYGVALIEGVGASLKDTEVVCKALGGVQHTLFGGMWEFSSKVADHADIAYTTLPLAAHHDTTYFTEIAGLQVLHCLEHKNGTGGETILVDGFYGAQQLKNQFPKDFEFLTKFNVEAEFIEEGRHHTHSAPVIKIDSETEDFVQVRFNIYDRAPMAFANGEDCRSYYRSLRNLSTYYENPGIQWRFKLNPGTVMVMDNCRVMHGRTAFTGSRVLAGSYVSRSDWLNKARVLNLIG